MKLPWRWLNVILVIIVLVCFGLFERAWSDRDFKNETKRSLAEMNAACPKAITADIRMDQVQFLEPNTMRAKYTLVTTDASYFNDGSKRVQLESSLDANLQKLPRVQQLLKRGYTVQYDWYARDGTYLFTTVRKR